jgi:hypothetical protein
VDDGDREILNRGMTIKERGGQSPSFVPERAKARMVGRKAKAGSCFVQQNANVKVFQLRQTIEQDLKWGATAGVPEMDIQRAQVGIFRSTDRMVRRSVPHGHR